METLGCLWENSVAKKFVPLERFRQPVNERPNEHAQINVIIIIIIIIIETAGTWDNMAIELVQEIDRRTTVITQDTRETVFLFQRLSIALQRGNAVSFLNTMNTE